jgi:hypothetical protein
VGLEIAGLVSLNHEGELTALAYFPLTTHPVTGLLEIFGRIPLVRELSLDEAEEHVKEPLDAASLFPFTLDWVHRGRAGIAAQA